MTGELTPRRRVLVRGALLLGGAALAAGAAYTLAVVPPTPASWYPKCHFHRVTGLHCPGCGLTRAVHAALNGRFEEAFFYNALGVVVLPYLAVMAARSLWSWLWGAPPPPSRPRTWVQAKLPWLFGGMLLLFWVLRNIPAYPFTLLAPQELTP